MPTLAIISGHCYAGGLLLALCHDKRIVLNNPKVKVCLSEINLGMAFIVANTRLLRATLKPQTNRHM